MGLTKQDDETVTQFHIRCIQADAWQRGYVQGAADAERDCEPADNPYVRDEEDIFT